MKLSVHITHLIVSLLLFSLSLPAQSGSNSPDKAKRTELNAKGRSLYLKSTRDYNEGKSDSAIIKLDAAIHYYTLSGNDQGIINALNNRGNMHYNAGQYEAFKKDAKEAWELAQLHMPDSLLNYGIVLNNIALYNKIIGNFDKAQDFYDQAINVFQKNYFAAADENLKRYIQYFLVTATINKGVIFRDKKDYEESKRYFNRALSLLNSSQNSFIRSEAIAYKELAISEWLSGEYEKAILFYNKSLSVIESDPGRESNYLQTVKVYDLQGLARIWLGRGQPEKARLLIGEAIKITKERQIVFDAFLSYKLAGDIFLSMGNFERAYEAYNTSLDSARSEFRIAGRHPDIATCHASLGKLESKRGNTEKALEHFQQALIFTSREFDDPDVYRNPPAGNFIINIEGLSILKQKGDAFLQLYENTREEKYLRGAFDAYQTAIHLTQYTRRDFYSDQAKLSLAEDAIAMFESAIRTALQLYKLTNEDHFLHTAFRMAEQNKARVLLESLTGQEALGISGLPDSLLAREDRIKKDLAFYKQTLLEYQQSNNDDPEKLSTLQDIIYNLEEANQQLQSYIEKSNRNYYDLKYNIRQVAVNDLQDRYLTDHTAIVEYFFGLDQIYVFMLTKNTVKVYTLDHGTELTRKIESLLASLHTPPAAGQNELSGFISDAHYLYRQLLEKVVEDLPPGTKRLVIIPDDVLTLLPMDLLLTRSPGTIDAAGDLPYLLRDFTISYNYSATLLLHEHPAGRKPRQAGVLGFAPDFGEIAQKGQRSCSKNSLYSLRCSSGEVNGIHELMQGKIYIGPDARKDRFLADAPDYQILHLATHACTDNDYPMLNRIWFADSYLSNFELFNLQLNADLVVLSACNTGSGKLLKGEGVQSLARGFLHAGCRSLVTSLWSVDDCATSEMMTRFYAELNTGKEKDEALRQAKLQFLASADKLKSHPYYWGAFVQVGDVSALKRGNITSWYLFGSAIILILAGIIGWRLKNPT